MSDGLTHLDLFTGIGGFALAAARAGFATVAFSEIEPFACRVLVERFPGIPNLGDITRITDATLGPVLALTGGVPCQPASLIGQQLGTDDERWLWPDALRCVGLFRPGYVLFENPPAILTLESGRPFAGILGGLAALGYDVWWDCLPAAAFGAGHYRNRVWIFAAHPDRTRLEGFTGNGPALGRQESHGSVAAPNLRDRKLTERRWYAQSGIQPVVDGIPGWLAELQLHAVGNAIVPQVAEPFFRWIRQIEGDRLT